MLRTRQNTLLSDKRALSSLLIFLCDAPKNGWIQKRRRDFWLLMDCLFNLSRQESPFTKPYVLSEPIRSWSSFICPDCTTTKRKCSTAVCQLSAPSAPLSSAAPWASSFKVAFRCQKQFFFFLLLSFSLSLDGPVATLHLGHDSQKLKISAPSVDQTK